MSSVAVYFLCQDYDQHQMTDRAFLLLLSRLIEDSSKILKKREIQNSTPVGYVTFHFFLQKISLKSVFPLFKIFNKNVGSLYIFVPDVFMHLINKIAILKQLLLIS